MTSNGVVPLARSTVWEEKESVAIVLTVQQIFASRGLRAADLVRVFGEFDELGSSAPPCVTRRYIATKHTTYSCCHTLLCVSHATHPDTYVT